ncbi:hypothetical protein [Planobispora takensis]|uniref:Uncharacterized protein n=1 Tax=Planobispora takensis TaxID=1367882 RepID=A0A8J3WR84_9ACTN|nr:hypothetical protein [Planobispora takensis]GIH98930.1 hypothetical protein Pta02_09390 [Planobispora takensis]
MGRKVVMTEQATTGRDDAAAAQEKRDPLYPTCRWIAAVILLQYGRRRPGRPSEG